MAEKVPDWAKGVGVDSGVPDWARGVDTGPSAKQLGQTIARDANASAMGFIGDLIAPAKEGFEALLRDVRRNYSAPPPKGFVQHLPLMDPRSKATGSIAKDILAIAGSPPTGAFQATVSKPLARAAQALPAIDPKTGQRLSKEDQFNRDVGMFDTALMGFGGEGLAARLAKVRPDPILLDPAGQNARFPVRKPQEAPKASEATTPAAEAPKPAAAAPEPPLRPIEPVEAPAAPVEGAEPAAAPAKRKRRPATLKDDEVVPDWARAVERPVERSPAEPPQVVSPEELHASQASWKKGKPYPPPREAPDPANLEPLEKGVFEMAKELNDALKLTHRQGRFRGANVRGVFRLGPATVRTRAMHEIDTLSHEGGHALEFQHKLPNLLRALAAHADEIVRLGHKYYGNIPQGVERQEGFAEFFRLYVTNPELAKAEAPRFYEAFEQAVQSDQPELLEKLRAVQASHEALMKAPSAVQARTLVATKPPPGRIAREADAIQTKGVNRWLADWAHEAYFQTINRFHGLRVAVDRMLDIYEARYGKRLDIPTHKDPERILQLASGARDAAMEDIRGGVRGYHSLDRTSVSLEDAVDFAMRRVGEDEATWDPERYHDFATYLNSRNMLAQWRRYANKERELPPDGALPHTHEQAIKTFEAANPHWPEAAQMVYDWANAIWKLRLDAGFITQAQYEQGLLNHPDYVPAMREMTNPGQDSFMGTRGGGRGGGTGKYSGGVRAQRGSTRVVVDPIYSLANQAMELRMLIARNDSALALRDIGRATSAAREPVNAGLFEAPGSIVEEVPASQLQQITVPIEEALISAMKEREKKFGPMSERDELEFQQAAEMITDILGEDAAGKIYRAGDIRETGEPIIYYWQGGRRGAIQLADGKLGKMMYRSYTELNDPMRGALIGALSWPARILRLNVVTHPSFLTANMIKDQPVAAAFSNVGYVPFVDWFRGVATALKPHAEAEAFNRYKAAGGTLGGMQSAAERQIHNRRSIQSLREEGFRIQTLPEQVATVSEISETGTRMGIFLRAEAEAKKKGLGDWEAAVEGAYQATDILNFNRRGAWKALQAFQRMLPFLNANIQGLDKFARSNFNSVLIRAVSGEKPRTPQEAEAFGVAMNAWAWLLGMAAVSAVYRASYGDDPEYANVNERLRQTNWVFKKGDGEYVTIPKPYDLGAGAALAERAVEAYLGDKKAPENAVKDMATLLVPQIQAPPVIPIGLLTNKDYFGTPIVPKGTENMEPRGQKDIYTSWLAEVAPFVGGSPAKTQYVEQQLIGGNWMPDINRGINELMKDRPGMADNLPDMFLVRRYVRNVTRGSASQQAMWDRLEKIDPIAEYFASLVRAGPSHYDEAYKRLEEMSPEARTWALVNTFGLGLEKQAHPLAHALKVSKAISDASKDIQVGDLKAGPAGETISLNPKQRREAFEALRYIGMVEAHNAMVEMGEPGFSHLKEMSMAAARDRLRKVDPRLIGSLDAYYANPRNRILPKEVADHIWSQARRRYDHMPTRDEFGLMVRQVEARRGYMQLLRPEPE